MARFVPTFPDLAGTKKGGMYTSIRSLGNGVVVQWSESLKISPWSGVQFWVEPIFFFALLLILRVK